MVVCGRLRVREYNTLHRAIRRSRWGPVRCTIALYLKMEMVKGYAHSGTQKVYLIVPTREGYPLSGITRNSPVQFFEANAEKRGLFVERTLTNFPFGADLDIEKTRSHRNPMRNCARRRHRVGLKI